LLAILGFIFIAVLFMNTVWIRIHAWWAAGI
jgi:hypothetical protein